MKKKKMTKSNDKILSFLIIILSILTITLIVVLINRSNTLDINSKLVIDLHNYFSTEDLNNCNGLFTYAEDKVEYKDIDVENSICLAYQKTDKKKIEKEELKADKKKDKCTKDNMSFKIDNEGNKCTVNKIKKSLINDTYKKIYGKDIKDIESFRIDNQNVCYLNGDYYYCGLSETFIYTIGNESTIYRVINKAEEKSSNIIIYDFFIKINGNSCFKNYTTATINNDCTDNYSDKFKVDFKFMKKYATKYKHIYKKSNNDSYFWVSSEPIN